MKRKITLLLIAGLFLMNILAAKGGVIPCLATCCFGPRVGLEMNDGGSIRDQEWMGFVLDYVVFPGVGSFVLAIDPALGKTMNEAIEDERLGVSKVMAKSPKNKGGVMPFLTACCIGPRVGLELNDGRKVRTIEWMTVFIPIIPSTIIALEALGGKKMSEIAIKENLDS